MKRKMIIVSLMLLALMVLPLSNKMPLIISVEIDNRSTILSDYEVHDPIVITCDEDFITQGWPGNGTIENPYILEHLMIVVENCASIMIHDTTAHFIIRNCWLGGEDLTRASHGIEAWRISNGLIENNMIHDFWAYGIFLGNSFDNIIKENFIGDDSKYGPPAISIQGLDSANNTILNNKCRAGGGNVIDIQWSSNSFVIGNNCSYNVRGTGIRLYNADNATILNNICNNNGNGITIAASQGVVVINNTLGWNTFNNAIDGGVDNSWDDGIAFGNIYGDYKGDEVYEISGSANSIDHYPRKADIIKPILEGTEDIVCECGISRFIHIYWYIIEQHPSDYIILKNGDLDDSGEGYDSLIDYTTIVNTSLGTLYNFTLIVYDTCGNNATDSVIITVVDTISPQLNLPKDIEYKFNTTENNIMWSVSDFNPHIYELYINGSLDETGSWEEPSIVIDIDGLSIGQYNYTLLVNDTSGNVAIDTVIVSVTEIVTMTTTTTITDTTTTTTTTNETTTDTDGTIPLDLIILWLAGIGGVCGIIALIMVIKRR
jgi:parallel beta-helix repeat protein